MKWITREKIKVDRIACRALSKNSWTRQYKLTDRLVLLVKLYAADSDPAGRGSRLIAGGFGALGLISKFSNGNLSFTMRSTQNASAGSEAV